MRSLAGLGVLGLVLVSGGAGAGAAGWETVLTGAVVIRVRTPPDMPGGREVWVEGEVAASARDIQSALVDHESFREWMPYVKESRLLSGAPGGEKVAYTRLELPFVSSRDYVTRVVDERLVSESGTGEFFQRWSSEASLLPSRSGVVRVRHNEGSWHVVPLAESRARFVYRFIVEPGGAIPGFLAGLGQKDAVLGTLRALEKRAHQLAGERSRAEH